MYERFELWVVKNQLNQNYAINPHWAQGLLNYVIKLQLAFNYFIIVHKCSGWTVFFHKAKKSTSSMMNIDVLFLSKIWYRLSCLWQISGYQVYLVLMFLFVAFFMQWPCKRRKIAYCYEQCIESSSIWKMWELLLHPPQGITTLLLKEKKMP